MKIPEQVMGYGLPTVTQRNRAKGYSRPLLGVSEPHQFGTGVSYDQRGFTLQPSSVGRQEGSNLFPFFCSKQHREDRKVSPVIPTGDPVPVAIQDLSSLSIQSLTIATLVHCLNGPSKVFRPLNPVKPVSKKTAPKEKKQP
jgi:hypothetical protein